MSTKDHCAINCELTYITDIVLAFLVVREL